MAETRRTRRFSEPGERIPMSFRVTPEFKRRIDRAAARSGRSIAQEIELRLDQSLGGDAGFPPEIAALLELLGRAMLDTGTGISGINHSAGHGFKPWLADRYAYSQAVYAAIHVLQKSLPDGPAEPHGLFAGGAYTRERAEQFGRQVADGILEAMRGRHPDPGTAALWAPR